MKSKSPSRTNSSQTKTKGDHHQLLAQIIDDRLRVISLHSSSSRQWLYQVEPPSVGTTRRAMKVLGDPLAREPGSFYRLKTAYQNLKRLETPYVEKVFECGLLHDLTPYIVTEWAPFESLYERLRLLRRPLTWDEAKLMTQNICRGLIALHEQGIAHGDLRPQHVLIKNTMSAPLIIDACTNSSFGAQPTPGLDKSWAYWAPERNTLSSATIASDMYSFGALLYFCLMGHTPFSPHHDPDYQAQLQSGVLFSPAQWLERGHLYRDPLPMGDHIPSHIQSLIKKLLSKNQRLRPTAAETLLGLEDQEGHEPLTTTPLGGSSENNPLEKQREEKQREPLIRMGGDSLSIPALNIQEAQKHDQVKPASAPPSLSLKGQLVLLSATVAAALVGLLIARW